MRTSTRFVLLGVLLCSLVLPGAVAHAATAPGAPRSAAASTSLTSASLTWTTPSSDGGSAITGYVVARTGVDAAGTGPWSGPVPASSRSATFNQLVPGNSYTLSVRAVTAAGTGPAASLMVIGSPSGVAMPVGSRRGWRQVFAENFDATVPRGAWPGSYSSRWSDYTGGPDTSGTGWWDARTTVSAARGVADYYLHSENGVPQCAAILPRLPAQTYGRYEVRFQVDRGLTGWASAWLLWPDDEVWPGHGEIDWPEGELTGPMGAFMHYANAAGGQDQFPSSVQFASGWHTATTEWTPGRVTFSLDGRVVGTSTTQVPSTPMHWVLQSETAYGQRPSSAGHIRIDWAVVYARA